MTENIDKYISSELERIIRRELNGRKVEIEKELQRSIVAIERKLLRDTINRMTKEIEVASNEAYSLAAKGAFTGIAAFAQTGNIRSALSSAAISVLPDLISSQSQRIAEGFMK